MTGVVTVREARLFEVVVVGAVDVGNVTPAEEPFEDAEEAIDDPEVDRGAVADDAETGAGEEPGTTDAEGVLAGLVAEDDPTTAAPDDADELGQAEADPPKPPSSEASPARADALAVEFCELPPPSLGEGSGPTMPSEVNCVAMYVALSAIYVVFGLSYERWASGFVPSEHTGSPSAQFSFSLSARADGNCGTVPPEMSGEFGPLFPGSPNMTKATIDGKRDVGMFTAA